MLGDFIKTTLSKNVLKKYLNHTFVETGTLWGHAVDLALECGFEKIYSIELDPNKFQYNIHKFSREIQSGIVEIIQGDSFLVFPYLLKKINQPATFWLDAHWDEGPVGEHKCPLLFELRYLLNHPIKNNKLLIDDRRIFGQVNSNWGEKITEHQVLNYIKQINSEYKIFYENGYVSNDIIAAKVAKKNQLSKLHL